MDKKDWITLQKMLGYCEAIIDFCKDVSSYEEFEADIKTIMASVFALIQIGELCASLSDDFKSSIKNIPWQSIKGLRNRIVHGYDEIEYHALWDTIDGDIPTLIKSINDLLP